MSAWLMTDKGEPELVEPVKEDLPPKLSPREMEVLQHMATGASAKETAVVLDMAKSTVETHAKHIAVKFGTTSKLGSVVRAAQLGMLDLTKVTVQVR